jgi:hypothetical protein
MVDSSEVFAFSTSPSAPLSPALIGSGGAADAEKSCASSSMSSLRSITTVGNEDGDGCCGVDDGEDGRMAVLADMDNKAAAEGEEAGEPTRLRLALKAGEEYLTRRRHLGQFGCCCSCGSEVWFRLLLLLLLLYKDDSRRELLAVEVFLEFEVEVVGGRSPALRAHSRWKQEEQRGH